MLLGLAAHRRCCRVLHLAPFVRAAVDIARSAALAHDSLAPEQAGVRVHEVTRLVEGAVGHETRARPADAEKARGGRVSDACHQSLLKMTEGAVACERVRTGGPRFPRGGRRARGSRCLGLPVVAAFRPDLPPW